jgi:D-cysteine desulfhydrase
MAVAFPDKLDLAQLPTPIHRLQRLEEDVPPETRLWIKRDDMTGCLASGNKVRKLEFTLARARTAGANVIITCGGVQSNHCRATVVLAAQLGMPVHLILRGEEEELDNSGNLFLDELCGASIDCYPSREFLENFETIKSDLIENYRAQGMEPWFIPIGASDGIGVWGYIHCCREIRQQQQQLGEEFDAIVCATGSGGTLAGLLAGSKWFDLKADIFGINVCDSKDYFVNKVREDLSHWHELYQPDLDTTDLQVNIIDKYVGQGYGKASPQVYAMIRNLASCEGVVLDPIYTAKAFYGMIQEIKQGILQSYRNVLFIHTGGLFGLMSAEHSDKIFS